MDETKDLPILDPKLVGKIFADAEAEAARLQKKHLDAAQYAGYARAAFHAMEPFYVKAAEYSEAIPQLKSVVSNGINLAGSITAEFQDMSRNVNPIIRQAYNTSGSVATFAYSTDSIATITFPGVVDLELFDAPPFFSPEEDGVYEKLCQIDPPLAETYREVGQAFHGTTADPIRAAIACMRQTLDHFFGYLAPDEAVRASSYWEPKSGDSPLQITRRERITYATHTHIQNPKRAKTLLDNIDVVLDAYQFLHQLHKRGALSEKQANKALRITKTFIETWVGAMNLSTVTPSE